MRVHILTRVILAFADCLLYSESQETGNGPTQHLSPNLPLSSSPVKTAVNQTSLSQPTNGNSSVAEEVVHYLSPFKVVRRHRPVYAGATHTFPVRVASRSYLPTEGLSVSMEGRPNNSTSIEAPQNSSSLVSKMTQHYSHSSVENHHSMSNSAVPQSSPPISWAASNFLPLPRKTQLSSLPVSRTTKPSVLESYAKNSYPRDSRETDFFSPGPRATPDSGPGSREAFSSPANSRAMNYSVPNSSTTHLSMPIFRTRYHFTPAFTKRYHSVPDSPATQNASHESHSFPIKRVQTEPSLDQVGLPLSHWSGPSQSLSKVPIRPGTTKPSVTNPELSLRPVARHTLPTMKGSNQSSFVPDSENYSSSFSILSGRPRSTLVERNSFNVDQDKSNHSSTAPTSDLLSVKSAGRSLPLSFGSGNLPRTKVVWNKSHELKPYSHIPYNSFEKDQYLLANGRTDASQSPRNTGTSPLYPQTQSSSSMFGSPPLRHSPPSPEATSSSTRDTIIRILDSNAPISSVNTNSETPRLKSHEEKAIINGVDFTMVGGNEVTHTEEITATADATQWDKKTNTAAHHATGYFPNPENLANDFSKESNNALPGVHNFLDTGTYKEEREGVGMDLANAAPSVVEDNLIIIDNTDLLEEDFRALMNNLEFLGEDDFTVIYVPDWEEDYLTEDDDPIVLKEDDIDEVKTRILTKGMISRTKFPTGIRDAATPWKDITPLTTLRETPEDVAVPTSNAVSKDVVTNPINDATIFFPKMFVRKSSAPVANSDKHLTSTTVTKNGLPAGDPITSEVNDILSVRDSETPIQQIILTQFKPEIILPENENNVTANAPAVLLENTTTHHKDVTYITQLRGDNSVTEHEINTTIPTVRISSLTNVGTRLIPDVADSMVSAADPLLNSHIATPVKEAIIKDYNTITTMEDYSTMGKGQRILSGRVIPRSSTVIPKEDIKATVYGLPRMDKTFADGDTALKSDMILSAKAGTVVVADKVILAEKNTPNGNTLRTFILDNDPKSAKDDSLLPQVNTVEHLVDRTKHVTNPTQLDPRVAIPTAYISPSVSDRTVTTSRKVYSSGSDDIIAMVEENSESEIKAPMFQMFRNDSNSRDMTSRSMGGGKTSNWAKTSIEGNTATENKWRSTEEYYGGSEKSIVPSIIPTSFAFGSHNDAFDVDDSDTMGFYSFQKEHNTAFFPFRDRATVPKGSPSSLIQALDSKVDPTPWLYEMTDSDPNVPLTSSMKNLKPVANRNMADVTTDGIEEIILKDQEIATVKQNDEAAEDIRFFLPANSIPRTGREDYTVLSDTDHGPIVRQTTILLDDNIKPAVIGTAFLPKTSIATNMEVATDSTIKSSEKAPSKETEESTLTMNYINAKHDSTATEGADPAKPILLTAITFEPNVSSAKLQETFHEKEDPFPHATRQPSELSAMNSAKIKDATLPEWQITESDYNMLPSETALFPTALTPMTESISGESKTTSIVNGNHATQDGGVSEFRRNEKSTILERTLPAFRKNTVTVIDTTKDESENGETFEYEVIPYVGRTSKTEGEEYIPKDDGFIDFSPTRDDVFDTLVTEDDFIFPETDSTSASTDIFVNSPKLNAFEAPEGNFVSDATKSLPKTTAPGFKEIIIHGQRSTAIPDTGSFLPKISHLEEKRSIDKDTDPNLVSSFTPAYAMPLTSNSADSATNPITLEDEGVSVTKSTPSSSNNKLSLTVRTTTQATHLKAQEDDDSSIVAEITKSEKGTRTMTSATDPDAISHTDDATEFVRSLTTPPGISLIKTATLMKSEAPVVSTENTEPKDGLASLKVNASPSMEDKDVLTTTDVPRIFTYGSVPEKVQGPSPIKPTWTETIGNKFGYVKSPAVTPEWLITEPQILVPANPPLGRVHASYSAPVPATIMVPGNSAVGDETSSLLLDNTTTLSGRVLPMVATTVSKGNSRNMGDVSKYELKPSVEKDKAIEPETLLLTEGPTIVEANDATLPTKNVRENVDQMITPLHDNVPKDYSSISEDSRIALKTVDTKPVMDIVPLTYGPDEFEALAPNSLSRIIIIPNDVEPTENHRTIFIGEDNSDTEADKGNFIGDPVNLKTVNPRTMDDSNFSQTENSTTASLNVVATAANDMDFLPDMSNWRVKKTLFSFAPDAVLDRTNTNPYTTGSTNSNSKDKIPLVKNDERPTTYNAVGLQAASTTTEADARTQEDETNASGPKLIKFPLGIDPVTSFTDSVIDDLPNEREASLTNPMTKGSITQTERAASAVANGILLPGKDDNVEGQFIIPGADTPRSIGDTALVTSETLLLLPDVTADEVQLSFFTEEHPLTDASTIVASKLSEPTVDTMETINEDANLGHQIFGSQRDPWPLPLENRLLTADPTSSGLSSSNFEDSASTTGKRVATTETDSSDAPLMTSETLSLLPDEAQLSVFKENLLTDASMIVPSRVSESVVENTGSINEDANPGGQIFGPQRDPWALPLENRLLKADSISAGVFSRNFKDSASTTGNRVATTERNSSDAPLVTSETLSLLPDEAQLFVITEDPQTDASVIVASDVWKPLVENSDMINEDAKPEEQIFGSQGHPWPLPVENTLLTANPTSSGLFSSNSEDSASTTGKRIVTTETDSSDAPLVTYDTLSLLLDEAQLSVFTEEDPLTDTSMKVTSDMWEPVLENIETINEDDNPERQIFGSQRDPWPLPVENTLLTADPTLSGLFSRNFEDSASTTRNRVAITKTDTFDAPLVTYDTLSLLPDEAQLSVFTEEDPLTDTSMKVTSDMWEPVLENIETINEDANPERQIFGTQRDPWALPLENRLLTANPISSGLFSRNFEDSASTTRKRVAITKTDTFDAPLVTYDTLSLLPDKAQLSIPRDDPLTDASVIVVSEVWEPLVENTETINEDANPEGQIFGSQRDSWALPVENTLLTADPTSSGLFSSNFEDSESTTGNTAAAAETDSSDAPLVTYDTLSLLPDEVQLSVFTEDPLTDTSMKVTSDMWEPVLENTETINEDGNPEGQIFGSQRDSWALPVENTLLTADPTSFGLFSSNSEDSASTTGKRVATTETDSSDAPLVTYNTLSLLPDEAQLSILRDDPLTDASMIAVSEVWEPLVENTETINEDASPERQIFGSQRDSWALPVENTILTANPTSSGLFSSNFEDSASTTGNIAATMETDGSDALLVTYDTLSLLPDEAQLSVFTEEDPLIDTSMKVTSDMWEPVLENIETINEDANPERQIFGSQRDPWALPLENRLLTANPISSGLFSRNFEDSASTTRNRVAITKTDTFDAPLVTYNTLSLLPDEAQLSVLRDDPLTDASVIVVSEVWEPLVENIDVINEDANPEGQIFGSQRDPWPLPLENRLLTADPTSSGLFSSNFKDSASTTGNRVTPTKTYSSDAPLMTSETLSLLPDEAQLSVFKENLLTDASMIVPSRVSESVVENTGSINEDANPGGQIFGPQRDPWALPLKSIVLPANSPSYKFSPTSSEHSSPTMAAAMSMPVKNITSSTDSPRNNSERLFLETVPSEKSSSTGVEIAEKEEIVTEAEGKRPYGTAYNDFASDNAVDRTGVNATNSLLIPTLDRKNTVLRRERVGIESNGTKSPNDKTNSTPVATGTLVKAIPGVQEIAFVEEKRGEVDKVAASFLPDTRHLPVGDTSPSTTDSTASSSTMPSHEVPASSKNAAGSTGHTSGALATAAAAGDKAHAKEGGTAAAEMTNPQKDILPVTSTSIPAAEGISYVEDGTEIVATVPNAHAEYTEARNNQTITEGNPLSIGYGHHLSTRYLTLPSYQLHAVHLAKQDSADDVIRTPTERRKIETEKLSAIDNPNSPDTPFITMTTAFQNTDTTVHASGPEYETLIEEDSRHDPKGRKEEDGDNSILEATNITPFLSHDSILQRDDLAPEGYLNNSEEDTAFTLDPNRFQTHRGYSLAKATNSPPETAASKFEDIVILEKDGLADTDADFLLPDISYPGSDPTVLEKAKTPMASNRDFLLASTETEAFPSKDMDSFDNKIAHGEDPSEVSGAEIEKIQEAVATPMTFFITPKANISYVGTYTEPLMDVTATSAFVPTKRSTPAISRATTFYVRYFKPQNHTTVSEANSTLVSTGDTTLLTTETLNFSPGATAGISPETFHLKERSLDDADVIVSEASGPVSEKPLPINGALIPEWNVLSVQSDPQALQLESTLPHVDSTVLLRNPAYTNPDTVGTVKEDPLTETASSSEKYPSPKRTTSAAAPFNLREDTGFRTGATPYEADAPIEEIASDEQEAALHRVEEVAEEDDIPQERENTPSSTYFSPFMSGNDTLEGKNSDPEDGSVFHEANNNHVIIDAINPPLQITTNGETKASNSISPRDEKPSTVVNSTTQRADDNIKTITADPIPDGMIKATTEFKGITNTEQNYSEPEDIAYLPDVADLSIKRKAQRDGDVGPDADSPLASKDTRPPKAGSTGPVPFATLLEDKDNSTFVPRDYATNNVAGTKFPKQETKTAVAEMADSQKDISSMTSFTAPADVRMPYTNTGNEYRKDLAANAAIPLTWKALVMVAKNVMLPSEYIQHNSESAASEVGTATSTGGTPLTALTKPICEHLPPSNKSQINYHGRDVTPIIFEALEAGPDNSLPNDAATLGQPLTKMETDLPTLSLVAALLPDDSSRYTIKAIYTRHAAVTARKKEARTVSVPDILNTPNNVPGADIGDRINPSGYQLDIIIEESASMEFDEIPFVEEDISAEGDVIYLEEENNSDDDLMTFVLDNNVSAYVTEDYTIAPLSPIINTPTLTHEPSQLGTYASYNKADSSYSSSEIATADPTETKSKETSHTVILEYEPTDSEIHTTMLKSVAPRTIAYSSSDGSKKISSRFLKMTTKEQNNKVVDDATTFLPQTSNPKKKRTDSSFALDPDTGFLTEESETFTKGTFGSAGEPASIENKETLDMNIAADVFTSGRNTSVTLLEEQYSKNNLKTVGSEISTSQDSTSPSELLMSHGTDRISHMDENMETVTDMVTTANMPATEKVASVGVLPVQDGDSPISKADVTMLLDNNPLLTHAKPSLPPDAKTDNAAASLQGKNEALLDDYFLVLEETETVVEPTEHDTNVPEITLLSKDANPLASEDNVIHIEESLSYDTDLVGGAHSNSEDNYITLESDAFYLNVIMNSHLTNANGPETIAFRDPITAGEKNSEDELYAKNLPTDKAKVPMETITMIDVITDGIKTTPQEVTPGKESNRAAVQVAAFEPDMPHSETRVGTHKDSHIVSDWDPAFTRTDPSSFRTESTNLAENTTSPESQETVIPKDTIDPRAECMITATDATSEEKEENSMAEITSLENDVTPMSFISHKTEDIEPTTNSGIADVITAEEETPTSLFSASILYNGYIKPEDGPIVSGANSAPVSTDDTTLLNDATVDNTQETLPLKEMSLDDADMTVSEASGPILEKSLPVNGALIPERNVLSVQSDPQALQLESTLPPADSTLLPRTPPYTDTDTVGTVKEDPATETATSGEKYPSPKRAISAAAIINLREHTDFMIETARYEADIFVEEIISGKHGVAFQREEEDIIAEEHGVTQEKENTLYSTDFSTYISSSNILMGNELDPQDYSTFPKREDINSISEVNKITTDLSKCAAQPASSQNSIPTVTSFSVPGADRISFDNQDSKTPLSYSDLTGDMSFMAQANPIVAKVPTPTSLPNRSEDDILISRSGTDKSSEDTTLSMDIISILEDEFTSEKVQDTLQVKDGSLADLKKAKSAYLLNLVTDHSAPMNNLGIQEGSITKTPTHLHAFPLDASRENTISSVDSTNTKYDPSTTREEDTTSEMSFDAITTSPGSSFLEEKFPVSSAAEVVAEDPPPTPTTHITRNVTGETISSVTDDAAPEEQTAITSEAHLTSVNDSIPESDVITTAVNFMNTFSDFISSVTDKLPLLKETPTSEFNTKLRHVETPTSDGAEGVSSITNTARLSPGVMSLTEEEVISYETGIISSTSNDAFLVSDDDDATVPANEVSDFMMQDLEGEKITVLDRTAPSKEDGPNATAKVNGFVQKDDIIEEKDMFSVADLTNSEKEDTTMSETSNSTEEDTADDHWLWMEGNPEDELNATVLILNASKNKDSSASEAKNTHEDKNTMKAFLTKLVGGPTESVTNVTDSFPTSPTAGHPTDSREDSTTATDVTNLKQEDSKDTL